MNKDKKKKYEPPVPTRVGKKKKKTKGPDAASKLPLGKYSASPAELRALCSLGSTALFSPEDLPLWRSLTQCQMSFYF